MSMFKNLGEAISANVNDAIQTKTDPAKMSRYYAMRAQDDLEKTRRAAAEVAADKMAAERKVAETEKSIQQINERVKELAQAGDEVSVRRLVEHRATLTAMLNGYKKEAESTKAEEMANIYREQKAQYERLQADVPEISANVSIAKAQERINKYNGVTGRISTLFSGLKARSNRMVDVANAEKTLIAEDSVEDLLTPKADIDAEVQAIMASVKA